MSSEFCQSALENLVRRAEEAKLNYGSLQQIIVFPRGETMQIPCVSNGSANFILPIPSGFGSSQIATELLPSSCWPKQFAPLFAVPIEKDFSPYQPLLVEPYRVHLFFGDEGGFSELCSLASDIYALRRHLKNALGRNKTGPRNESFLYESARQIHGMREEALDSWLCSMHWWAWNEKDFKFHTSPKLLSGGLGIPIGFDNELFKNDLSYSVVGSNVFENSFETLRFFLRFINDFCHGSGLPNLAEKNVSDSKTTQQSVFANLENDTRNSEMNLIFSGGGFRATLFQLGILLSLRQKNLLGNIRRIVAVSGGSVLAGHIGKNWSKIVGEKDDFLDVASELLKFVRKGVRNQVFAKWLWTRLIVPVWFVRKWSLSWFLENEYAKHFKNTTFEELDCAEIPELSFVATDSTRQERVVFSQKGVFRIPIHQDRSTKENLACNVAPAKGIRLSLAVAASSCFPPIFSPFHLTHNELGLNYGEFKESLLVNDGGVSGNLGIAAFWAMYPSTTGTLIVCNAERMQYEKPSNSTLADLATLQVALSQSDAISLTRSRNDVPFKEIQFAKRSSTKPNAGFTDQTSLLRFRTDLDALSWPEIYSLVQHGADSAITEFGIGDPDANEIRETVDQLIAKADGPHMSVKPNDLASCHRRSYLNIAIHATLLTLLTLSIFFIVYLML